MKNNLSSEFVRYLFEYDKSTGNLIWKKDMSTRAKKGIVAGCIENSGYKSIRINRVSYQSHRLVWLHVYGNWPLGLIDHKDGNRRNNKLDNLRDASSNINSQNIRSALKNNKTSGLLGVSTQWNKWKAQIYFNGKKKYLGSFDTPELAHQAYLQAKRIHHEGCCI